MRWLALLLLFGCPEGPKPVDVTPFDVGGFPDAAPLKDAGDGLDATLADTGTVTMDAGEIEDAGPADTGTVAMDAGSMDAGDAGPMGIDAGDAGVADVGDAAPMDAGDDGGLQDAGLVDGAAPDGGPPDTGQPDTGPIQLIEDFTNPADEIFTCPDQTLVMPGVLVENGTQCLGIDGSGCPADRGLPGPGDALCADPLHNPFIGAGQCVSDFFGCFDPTGTCNDDGMGTFTWGNGAQQIIQVDGMTGALIQSEFIPSTSSVPCIIALPETPGGTRVLYTRQ